VSIYYKTASAYAGDETSITPSNLPPNERLQGLNQLHFKFRSDEDLAWLEIQETLEDAQETIRITKLALDKGFLFREAL
jgi:hypothetical protein